MILIFSGRNDPTTCLVIEWLISKNTPFKRININQTMKSFSITIDDSSATVNFFGQSPKKIWHRRGRFNLVSTEKSVNQPIYNYLKKEADSVIKSTEISLKNKIEYIGSFLMETENYKLTQLECAKECGLKIPDTLVTTNKEDLLKFFNSYDKCITKDIRYPVNIELKDEKLISTGVKVVTREMIDKLDSFFAPVLAQNLIEKKYEIRLFFFKEKFYPMAIFSQNNSKTKVDFRNYDNENPNRCVPVKLPEGELLKIKNFITKYNLNTGSIDLICTTEDDYVFLEVNPQGQLDWLSKNCNYYIEKDIAISLNS